MSKPLETITAPAAASTLTATDDKRMMVAAGRASLELGSRIAERIGLSLTGAGLKTFSDGEVYCRYSESIRGADIFIVQSICGSEREGLTVNDALMELLLMVHAAKHASAHRIIAVTPWYGYSRQDKKSAPREPISARLVAELLEVAGIDRLVTMDLHAGQVQGFFSRPVDHMTAMPILTQFVQDRLSEEEELVIIAPDAGRVKLVRKFAQKVGAPYALLEKERPAHQVAEIGYVIGDVKGKVAVIVDDIIDTGGTLAAAAQTVLDEGARAQRHGVGDHDPGERRGLEDLERIAGEDAVGGHRVDLLRALVEHRLGRSAERAARVDDVVHDHRGLALHVADHVADLRHLLGGPLLLEQRVGRAHLLGELAHQLHAPGVRGDDHQVLFLAQPVEHELREDRHGGHVVHGPREEALHLAGVQVHRDQAVDARHLQRLGHEPGADGLARS